MRKKLVIVFSGGMDSATLLYFYMRAGWDVYPLAINYGQRHARELQSATAICDRLGIPLKVLRVPGLSEMMAGSSQTDPTVPVPHGHYEQETMKLTVVPNRNMILLGMAASYAVSMGAEGLAYGAHGGDHAIYPDCRLPFVEAMRSVLKFHGWTDPPKLFAPFLDFTKSGVAAIGQLMGVPWELTWSCYEGKELHCGKCGTCVERREAFALAGIKDPTTYRA